MVTEKEYPLEELPEALQESLLAHIRDAADTDRDDWYVGDLVCQVEFATTEDHDWTKDQPPPETFVAEVKITLAFDGRGEDEYRHSPQGSEPDEIAS